MASHDELERDIRRLQADNKRILKQLAELHRLVSKHFPPTGDHPPKERTL
jgi:hypothetical protein